MLIFLTDGRIGEGRATTCDRPPTRPHPGKDLVLRLSHPEQGRSTVGEVKVGVDTDAGHGMR